MNNKSQYIPRLSSDAAGYGKGDRREACSKRDPPGLNENPSSRNVSCQRFLLLHLIRFTIS